MPALTHLQQRTATKPNRPRPLFRYETGTSCANKGGTAEEPSLSSFYGREGSSFICKYRGVSIGPGNHHSQNRNILFNRRIRPTKYRPPPTPRRLPGATEAGGISGGVGLVRSHRRRLPRAGA